VIPTVNQLLGEAIADEVNVLDAEVCVYVYV
jgi:hypothetical protein